MADESIYMQELKVRAIVTSIAAEGTLLRRTSSTGGREYEAATGISIATNGLVTITGNLHMYTSAILLDDDQDSYIIADGDDRIKFVTNSLERFYLTNSGILMNSAIDLNGNDLILDADGDSRISAATDDIVIHTTNNTERLRVTDSGIVMNSNIDLNGNDLILDAAGTMYQHEAGTNNVNLVFSTGEFISFNSTGILVETHAQGAQCWVEVMSDNSSTVDYPEIVLDKSHSDTISVNNAACQTQDDEILGIIRAEGRETDGGRDPAARIVFEQDGTSQAAFVPGALVFQTSGTTTRNNERLRISSDGTISMPSDNQNLKLGGGLDMGIYYDGTNANIDTDLVAASDLTIDCGTDKTVVLEIPVWEDLNFDPTRAGGPSATRPDDVTINSVYHKEFTSANNQSCGSVQEVPHKAKTSETMYPHFHCFLKNGETAGTTGVTFTIYWELRQSGSTTSGNVPLSVTSTELTNNPDQFFKEDTTGFSGPTAAGGQLAMTIARTAGNAGDVIVTTYGVHYKIDTIGSRTRSAK